MTIASTATSMGRALAESLMIETCTITRVTGQVLDEITGEYTDTVEVVYSGPCKVKVPKLHGLHVLTEGRRLTISRQELHLPVSASGGVAQNDVVTIDSSPDDASLVGHQFRATEWLAGSFATARRIAIEDVQ